MKMDLFDKIHELSLRIPNMLEKLGTEEATKLSLVVPFIEALGYIVSDPTDVIPEYTADVGIKKGEKVDYALLIDGNPKILIECKHHNIDLKNDRQSYSQLFRYCAATKEKEVSFGVLTNGLIYKFYADLDKQNVIDKEPFFEFDMMRDVKEPAVEELRKFSKFLFNRTSIRETALELKYKKETKDLLYDQLQNPDRELVRFVATKIYGRNLTSHWMKKFTVYTKLALNEVIKDKVTQAANTLVSSLEPGGLPGPSTEIVSPANQADESYYIIRTILREVVHPNRVTMRNFKNYFGILLDDNQRKPLCHLHFSDSQKYVVFFDTKTTAPERVSIQNLYDLSEYSERLKASVERYDPITVAQTPNRY